MKIDSIQIIENPEGKYAAAVTGVFDDYQKAQTFAFTAAALITRVGALPATSAAMPAPAASGGSLTQRVQTEHGVAEVANPGGLVFTATLVKDGVPYTSGECGTADAAIDSLLTTVGQAAAVAKSNAKPVQTRTTPAKTKAAPEPAQTPAPTSAEVPAPTPAKPPGEQAPPELVGATNFRQVMQWMIDNGHATQDQAVTACEKYRATVPALNRLPGDLSSRVERALAVMLPGGAA